MRDKTKDHSLAEQEARVARVEETVGAVLTMAERLHELQRRTQELEARFDDELGKNLVAALRDEMRERIQLLLEEQRICLRQLSLQATEEAILSDRARRATELRLEELTRRLEKLAPASAT